MLTKIKNTLLLWFFDRVRCGSCGKVVKPKDAQFHCGCLGDGWYACHGCFVTNVLKQERDRWINEQRYSTKAKVETFNPEAATKGGAS